MSRPLSSFTRLGLFLLLGLLALPRVSGAEEPTESRLFLYEIRLGDSVPSYLFGTLHLPRPEVVAKIDELGPAYDDADEVLTEIALTPEAMGQMMAAMLLPANESLSDLLSKDVEDRLREELQAINPAMTLSAFQRMQPWALSITLSMLEDQMRYPNMLALDMVLYNRANNDGKATGGLETLDEQLSIFTELERDEQIQMLRDVLQLLKHYRTEKTSMLDEMARVYLEGDLEAVGALLESSLPGADEALNAKIEQRLMTRRNHTMAERIAGKIRKDPERRYLFAVGAGHLYGPDGIPELLETDGFHVERVSEVIQISPTP